MCKLILTFLLTLPLYAQSTPQPTLPVYTSIPDMLAHANPRGPQQAVHVLGYTSPGDGGGGAFYATNVVGLTNTGTCFRSSLNSTYAWMRVMDDTVNPQIFGAVGNGVADDTSKMRQAFDYVQSRGGGVISLGNNKVYNLASVTTSYPLYSFTNVVGVTIEGNGSTFNIGSATNYGTFLQFTGGSNITIQNLTFYYGRTNIENLSGPEWVVFRQGTEGIKLENDKWIGGAIAYTFRGSVFTDGGTDDNRVRDITALNCSFDHVYYCQLFQGAGDNYFARGINCIGSGRAYYVSNAKNHDVVMQSRQGGPFSDVLINCYASSNVYSKAENIKLVYNSPDGPLPGALENSGDTHAELTIVGYEFSDVGPGTLQNIDIQMNVNYSASKLMQAIFSIRKFGPDHLADPLPRGHKVRNIKLSGYCTGIETLQNHPVQICAWGDDNWTGDSVENISVENLTMIGTPPYTVSILADGRAFQTNGPTLTTRNVRGAGSLLVVNNATGFGAAQYDCSFSDTSAGIYGSGALNIPGGSYLHNVYAVGGVRSSGYGVYATDNETPDTGKFVVMTQNSGVGILQTGSFNNSSTNKTPLELWAGGVKAFRLETDGTENSYIGRNFYGDTRLNGGKIYISSSATPLTGSALIMQNDGTASIFDSSIYTGGYMPIIWKTKQTNQMWLTTDGVLVLTNKISIANQASIKGLTPYADNAAALAGGLVAGDLYRIGDTIGIVH